MADACKADHVHSEFANSNIPVSSESRLRLELIYWNYFPTVDAMEKIKILRKQKV